MGVIYKTTNKLNRRIYVGKRVFNKEKFLKSTYYGSGLYLNRSIAKHGIENFTREIIEEVGDNSLLGERERYWIKTLDCVCPKGYNYTEGGENEAGGHPCEETRKRLSESHKGHTAWNRGKRYTLNLSEEEVKKRSETHKERWRRAKLENPNWGKPSEETRRKIGEAGRGRPSAHKNKSYEEIYGIERAKQMIEKMRLVRKGQPGTPHSEESKKKLSETHKGMHHTEETKEKLRRINIERHISKMKLKRKEALLAYYKKHPRHLTDKHKEILINAARKANTGKHPSEEAKRKRSEGLKKSWALRKIPIPIEEISCACGCGIKFNRFDNHRRERRYIDRHRQKMKKTEEEKERRRMVIPIEEIECNCGCGQKMNKFYTRRRERKFLRGHSLIHYWKTRRGQLKYSEKILDDIKGVGDKIEQAVKGDLNGNNH